MKNLPQDVCGPGGGLRRFKQLPDLAMRGRKVGPTCQKQLGGRSRRGLLKWKAKDRQPEERKAFNPSIRKMESTEKPSKREAKCGDSYGGGNAFAKLETKKRSEKLRASVRESDESSQNPKDKACMHRGSS